MKPSVFGLILAVFVPICSQQSSAQSDYNFVRNSNGAISQNTSLILSTPDFFGNVSDLIGWQSTGIPGGTSPGAGLTASGTRTDSGGVGDVEVIHGQTGLWTSVGPQPLIKGGGVNQYGAEFDIPPGWYTEYFPRTGQYYDEDVTLVQSPSSTLADTFIEVKFNADWAGSGVNGAFARATIRFNGTVRRNGQEVIYIIGDSDTGTSVFVLNEWGFFDEYFYNATTFGGSGNINFAGIGFYAADGDHIESNFFFDTLGDLGDYTPNGVSPASSTLQVVWDYGLYDTSSNP